MVEERQRHELPGMERATILVKAAPRVGETHGELVCCAGINAAGKWVRLYPVAFRTLDDAQKFARWDIIEYEWQLPRGDSRTESRRLKHKSLSIVDNVRASDRQRLIARYVDSTLDSAAAQGKSLTLIRPAAPDLIIEAKDRQELQAETNQFKSWHQQDSEGLFGHAPAAAVPYEPAPYRFKFRYRSGGSERMGTCQDWEIEATFLRWRREYGETETLKKMRELFGEEYPARGFVFAMGTHRAYPQWLINGLLRLDHGAEEAAAAQGGLRFSRGSLTKRRAAVLPA
jgi:hypothetical protein